MHPSIVRLVSKPAYRCVMALCRTSMGAVVFHIDAAGAAARKTIMYTAITIRVC